MKILLTNDDGIASKGLRSLCFQLQQIAEVTVVAPEREQSAVGHAITIADPLRVISVSDETGFSGHAVSGTPADCVKIAIRALLSKKPDMVVSGINLGSNTATNILYSGTVSAATEGTILGIPSIAVSLDTFENPDFSVAADFMRGFVPKVHEKGLPKGISLNVNVPAIKKANLRGVEITKMGKARFDDKFHKRVDPSGRAYYWQAGENVYDEKESGTDNGAITSGKISVTPIHYDLTDYKMKEELESWGL